MRTERKFTSEFKAKVALEVVRELEMISSLSQKHKLSSTQINK